IYPLNIPRGHKFFERYKKQANSYSLESSSFVSDDDLCNDRETEEALRQRAAGRAKILFNDLEALLKMSKEELDRRISKLKDFETKNAELDNTNYRLFLVVPAEDFDELFSVLENNFHSLRNLKEAGRQITGHFQQLVNLRPELQPLSQEEIVHWAARQFGITTRRRFTESGAKENISKIFWHRIREKDLAQRVTVGIATEEEGREFKVLVAIEKLLRDLTENIVYYQDWFLTLCADETDPGRLLPENGTAADLFFGACQVKAHTQAEHQRKDVTDGEIQATARYYQERIPADQIEVVTLTGGKKRALFPSGFVLNVMQATFGAQLALHKIRREDADHFLFIPPTGGFLYYMPTPLQTLDGKTITNHFHVSYHRDLSEIGLMESDLGIAIPFDQFPRDARVGAEAASHVEALIKKYGGVSGIRKRFGKLKAFRVFAEHHISNANLFLLAEKKKIVFLRAPQELGVTHYTKGNATYFFVPKQAKDKDVKDKLYEVLFADLPRQQIAVIKIQDEMLKGAVAFSFQEDGILERSVGTSVVDTTSAAQERIMILEAAKNLADGLVVPIAGFWDLDIKIGIADIKEASAVVIKFKIGDQSYLAVLHVKVPMKQDFQHTYRAIADFKEFLEKKKNCGAMSDVQVIGIFDRLFTDSNFEGKLREIFGENLRFIFSNMRPGEEDFSGDRIPVESAADYGRIVRDHELGSSVLAANARAVESFILPKSDRGHAIRQCIYWDRLVNRDQVPITFEFRARTHNRAEEEAVLNEVLRDGHFIAMSIKNIHQVDVIGCTLESIRVTEDERGSQKQTYHVVFKLQDGRKFEVALKKAVSHQAKRDGFAPNELHRLMILSGEAATPIFGDVLFSNRFKVYTEQFIPGVTSAHKAIDLTDVTVEEIAGSWLSVVTALGPRSKNGTYLSPRDMQKPNIMYRMDRG
ncbi:MAG TPA: hypothetical protein VJA17_01000, partial [Candidatus Omnitrophota bacterium]|nr:hypothetical protein [Candidatus Omnitrophota bacterium]